MTANYRTINYETQDGDADSVLNYYRKLITLRAGNDVLKYGAFTPLFATRRVMAYKRELNGEALTVVLSFSKRIKRAPYRGSLVADNYGKAEFDGRLQPYEAVIIKENGT